MFYNETINSYVLIGTVYGGGYNCKNFKVSKRYRGEGRWNKVSFHVPWIKETMIRHGEKVCEN